MLQQTNNQPEEEEAARTRSFLEDGADVRAEPFRESRPVTPRVSVPGPVGVEVPDTVDVPDEIEADDEVEALVVLEFGHLDPAPDFGLHVFVNTPGAGPGGSEPTEPGYLGTVNFFHDHDHHAPTVARLPARRAIQRTRSQGPIALTLVPVGVPGRRLTPRDIDVTVSVELVRAAVD